MSDWPIDPDLLDVLDWHQDEKELVELRHEAIAIEIEKLPDHYATVINAVFFERVSQRDLARRLKITRSEVVSRCNAGLEMLRYGTRTKKVPAPTPAPKKERPKRCQFVSPWGRCQQKGRAVTDDPGQTARRRAEILCSFHRRVVFEGVQPDAFYHQKIVSARLECTDDYLTPV